MTHDTWEERMEDENAPYEPWRIYAARRPASVSEAWAVNKRNVRGEQQVSNATLRELDAHDLGDGDESCDVSGCDDYCTHALREAGWICERHSEIAEHLRVCAVCGALTVGKCEDDHTTSKTPEQIRTELLALVVPKKSAHSFDAPWKPSR